MPCQPWPCRTSCILNLVDSSHPSIRAPVPDAHCCAMPCYAMALPAPALYSKTRRLEPGLVFYFQYPSSSPDRSAVQTIHIRQRLLPRSPSPFSKSSQVEWSANKHPCRPGLSQRMLAFRVLVIQVIQPQSGARVSLACLPACLPLHIFQWALCNWSCWRCAAGAGAGACTGSSAVVSPSLL
jgi:hypothetical protein